ncbi:transposase [Nocardia sp. NPDC059764]|uniref:transposase n=1 Tax=Nocardia sp. NPDC059764 TaxID=3346939 RepID=UPI00365EDC03
MAAPSILDDELWAVVEPLLPVKPDGTPGPAQMDSRLAPAGDLVRADRIGWESLPQKLGFGSGMTCWRRLQGLASRRAFEQIHQAVLARAHAARLIDFDRVMVDGSHARARRGAAATGPARSTASRPVPNTTS